MALNSLHHVTVVTDALEETRDFYQDILGLTVGFRPAINFPGYWLYCGEVPVVHLVGSGARIGGGKSADTGPFDHFAFLADDFEGVRAKLDARAIKYFHNHLDSPATDQLFFRDNNKVMIELNFPAP